MKNYRDVSVRLTGAKACFTNPAFKAERMSYRVPTPTALRGAVEAIYWHPGLRIDVIRILVLKPIVMMTFTVNELAAAPKFGAPFICSKDKVQMRCTVLRDVDYVVHARMSLPSYNGDVEAELNKHLSILTRRLERGQYYRKPFLGMSDYPAWARPVLEDHVPIQVSEDLGRMLWKIEYTAPDSCKAARVLFYHAMMHNGVIDVPYITE